MSVSYNMFSRNHQTAILEVNEEAEPSMHFCNPSTLEVETRKLQVQGQAGSHIRTLVLDSIPSTNKYINKKIHVTSLHKALTRSNMTCPGPAELSDIILGLSSFFDRHQNTPVPSKVSNFWFLIVLSLSNGVCLFAQTRVFALPPTHLVASSSRVSLSEKTDFHG